MIFGRDFPSIAVPGPSPTEQVLDSAARQRFVFLVRFFVYIALAVHVALALIMVSLDIMNLAVINVGSICIYIVAIFMGRRNHIDFAYLLCTFEVLAHAVIATLILGWMSGFHYYVSVIALFGFFHPSRRLWPKLVGAVIMFALYAMLFAVAQRTQVSAHVSLDLQSAFEKLNLAIFFIVNVLLGLMYTKAVEDVETRLRSANRRLDRMARTDALTGLLNRHSMVELLTRAVTDVEQGSHTFTLILGDVDDFKSINDQYGHNCGDQVLNEVADLLRLSVRMPDQIARWGGEEFLIFLPDTGAAASMLVADRIRRRLEDHVTLCGGIQISVTMSFGVSQYRANETFERTILGADRALYAGKAQGKNCVVLAAEHAPRV